jgi:DNA modification methylase
LLPGRNVKVAELREKAKALKIPRYSRMRKAELVEAIAAHEQYDPADNSAKSYNLAIATMRDKLASFRCERIGDATLYLGDCRELLPLLPSVDAMVADPPYGIGETRKDKSRTIGPTSILRDDSKYRRDYGDAAWDDCTQDEALSLALAKAKWAIVFGGNYYSLPKTSCWLVWDKLNGDTDFADCELAWTNLPKAVRRIRFLWNGCMRRERDIARVHPTQKPVDVMAWCIEHIPGPNQTILDPFMGSGTTGVACAKLGRKFIGIEIEPKYFDIACKRIEKAYAQADMFVPAPAALKPRQTDIEEFLGA